MYMIIIDLIDIIVENRNRTNDSSVINLEAEQESTQDEDRNDTHNHNTQHHTTPFNHFQPIAETQNTGQDNDDIATRSKEDEDGVFAVICDLFPLARENDIGIKSFYFQVKETLGMDLDDNLWVTFVLDTVYTMINNYRQRTSQAPYTYVKHLNIPHCDISLS